MNTEFPTTTIYFIYCFTYCNIQVYNDEVDFFKDIIKVLGLEIHEPTSQHQRGLTIDTRILMHIFAEYIKEKYRETSLSRKYLS